MSTEAPVQQAETASESADTNTSEGARVPKKLQQLKSTDIAARLVRQKIWTPCNKNNQHFMGAIVGREGSGKSGTALTICETVDPGFHAERVFFDPADLMEWADKDERQPGDAAIVDEAGVGLGSRSWYDKDQILLNQALQTARDDNLVIIFTLPRLSELDSQTRGRLHSFIECVELEEGVAVTVKWKNLVPSRDEQDYLLKPFPRLKVNNRVRRITRVQIGPPSGELWETYNEHKANFKSELYQETIASLRGEDPDAEEEKTPSEIADEIARSGNLDSYIKDNYGQRYIDRSKIKNEFDVGDGVSKQIKTALQEEWDVDAM